MFFCLKIHKNHIFFSFFKTYFLALTYQNNSKSLDIKCPRLNFVPFHISLKPYLSTILPLSLNAMNLILAKVQGDSYLVPVQFCPRLRLSCSSPTCLDSGNAPRPTFTPYGFGLSRPVLTI